MSITGEEIGANIARIRKEKGISGAYMARATGFKTASGYFRYEQYQGARLPLKLAKEIAEILDVDITDFFKS